MGREGAMAGRRGGEEEGRHQHQQGEEEE